MSIVKLTKSGKCHVDNEISSGEIKETINIADADESIYAMRTEKEAVAKMFATTSLVFTGAPRWSAPAV